jgi:hypothetical protein
MVASRTADSALFTQQLTRLQSQCDELQQMCTAAELRAKTSALDGVGAEVGRAVVAHVSTHYCNMSASYFLYGKVAFTSSSDSPLCTTVRSVAASSNVFATTMPALLRSFVQRLCMCLMLRAAHYALTNTHHYEH